MNAELLLSPTGLILWGQVQINAVRITVAQFSYFSLVDSESETLEYASTIF